VKVFLTAARREGSWKCKGHFFPHHPGVGRIGSQERWEADWDVRDRQLQ
jgi:hypothetical protein